MKLYLEGVKRGPADMPLIRDLLAHKPEMTRALNDFTEAVMRGPSPLGPGMRELIAAFTSKCNDCVF